MKSKKRGLIIIILASFAILADIALFILEKSGYMVGHEQPPLYYIGGVAIGVTLADPRLFQMTHHFALRLWLGVSE